MQSSHIILNECPLLPDLGIALDLSEGPDLYSGTVILIEVFFCSWFVWLVLLLFLFFCTVQK